MTEEDDVDVGAVELEAFDDVEENEFAELPDVDLGVLEAEVDVDALLGGNESSEASRDDGGRKGLRLK